MKILPKSILGLTLLLPLAACGRRGGGEARPTLPVAPDAAVQGGVAGLEAPRKPSAVVVPAALRGRWKAARVAVVELASRKETVHIVPVGSDFPLPGTGLSLRVENLLPDFSMGGGVITSRSERLDNPAAQVRVSEGGREVFKGWLFARFPEAHPFEHPAYALRLVEFVP